MRETLQQLSVPAGQTPDLPGSRLIDVLFGGRPPRFSVQPPVWTPINTRLDESQKCAISKALQAQDIALVHGPPGELYSIIYQDDVAWCMNAAVHTKTPQLVQFT